MLKQDGSMRQIGGNSRARQAFRRSAWLTRTLPLVVACAHFVSGARAEPLPLSQLQHKSWTPTEGAPAHNDFLTQGGDGVLWISADGLYRFDGIKFSSFRLPEGTSPTANYRYLLRVSSSGVLFAGSFYEGIVTVDHDKIRAYGVKDGLPRAPIVFLAEGPDRRMRCVSAGRLLVFDGDRWSDEGAGTNLPAGVADTLLFDRAGRLWVATNDGRLYFRRRGERSFQLTGESWDAALGIMALIESPDGGLWIGLQNFRRPQSIIRQLNVEGHSAAEPLRLEYPQTIWDILFDQAGGLWVTGKGVRRITFAGARTQSAGTALRVLRDEVVMDGLSSTTTKYLCKDNDGDIWVSTRGGIERFRTPALVAVAQHGSELASTSDVAPGTGGRIWLHRAEERISAYQGNQLVAAGPRVPYCGNLFEDRDGTLWYRDLTDLWRFERGRLAKVALPKNLNVRRLMQIAQLEDGSMVFLFDTFGLWTWKAGEWSGLPPASKSDGQITAIFTEPPEGLWLGYASGRVATWNGRAGGPIVSRGQSTLGMIYAFLQTPFGLLVSGSNGVAVLVHGQLERLTFGGDNEVRGVSGMIQSVDGDLWLNSALGVVRIPRQELERAFAGSKIAPIGAELFNEPQISGPARILSDLPTVARDATGRIWFNTSDTIAYIDPANIAKNTVPPIVTVSSISSDGHALDRTTAPAGNHTLRIQYFGSNLTAPEKVRYKYRLDGVDESWQDVNNRTEAVYTRLRPGAYSFQVMATNGEGVWSQPVDLAFTVLPTFYQTGWFLSLCGLAVIGLVVLTFRLRLNSIARRLRDRAEERANERIRIARDLHDTLLQAFQGLMLSFHVAAQAVPDTARARQLLESSLVKADRLMIEARDRVSRLRSESLEGVALPDALKALGEELTAHESIRFDVQIKETPVEIVPHIKDELFCIAREAITNSFRHADAHEIGATLDYGKRALSMICHDDGCGIEPETMESAPRQHYGMLGMRERARRIGATFSCDSKPGEGTTVTVRIPASRAYIGSGFLPGWLRFFQKAESQEL
jgi:signal transduction histidine kinase/ligand-binding sensor domain-containing protein